jgi:CRISPR-associated protein Cas2
MRDSDRLFVVAYDIRDQKRWRRVYRAMKGHGEWRQLSVFQCRLSRRGLMELRASITGLINHNEDHVVILDLGPVTDVQPRVSSLGKTMDVVERRTIIV